MYSGISLWLATQFVHSIRSFTKNLYKIISTLGGSKLHSSGLHTSKHPFLTSYIEDATLTFHLAHAIQKRRGMLLGLPILWRVPQTSVFVPCGAWW